MRSFLSIASIILCIGAASVTGAAAETFRVGALSSPGDPYDVLWSQFADDVKHASNSRLEAELFVRGEVGGEEVLMQAVRRGRIEVSIFTSSGLSAVIPEMAVLMAPYVFDSLAEADYVLDAHLKEFITDLAAEKNLVVLGWADEGFLNVFSVSPLRTPADTSGYRMRARQVPSSPLFLDAIGADVVALTFPDLIPALQTGLAQGGEAGAMTFASYGLAPVAPYYTLTRHAYSSGIYAANAQWFGELDSSLQSALRESIPDAGVVRERVRARNEADLQNAVTNGFTVYTPTLAERNQWRAAAQFVPQQLIEQIGGRSSDLYDLILAGKAAFKDLP